MNPILFILFFFFYQIESSVSMDGRERSRSQTIPDVIFNAAGWRSVHDRDLLHLYDQLQHEFRNRPDREMRDELHRRFAIMHPGIRNIRSDLLFFKALALADLRSNPNRIWRRGIEWTTEVEEHFLRLAEREGGIGSERVQQLLVRLRPTLHPNSAMLLLEEAMQRRQGNRRGGQYPDQHVMSIQDSAPSTPRSPE